MTKIYEAIWRPYATVSYIELLCVHDKSTPTHVGYILIRRKSGSCGQ